MRTLYFDCFAGASGNMLLAALCGLGVNQNELVQALRGLDIPEFHIEFETVDRSGISALHADVIVPEQSGHRHLRHIVEIIDRSTLSDGVKQRSIAIFSKLAEAEARVHGIDVQKVHFHEVGSLDAIVDIVGCCIAFEILDIENFVSSAIHVGSGFVDMEHGRFPVPPPAVGVLLENVPIYSTEITGELITPTGAAIIATVCSSYGRIPNLIVEQSAYGAGTRTYEKFPNVVRLMVGEVSTKPVSSSDRPGQRLTIIETNLDDVSPQVLGYVMERSFDLGALDCWFTPIQMKKNRPATMVSILCEPATQPALKELLYTETTTLGVRVREVERECLERQIACVDTEFGNIDIKFALYRSKVVNAMPEYEQVRAAAREHSVPFRTVSKAAIEAFERSKLEIAANASL